MLAVGSECSPCQQLNFISLFLYLGLIFCPRKGVLPFFNQRMLVKENKVGPLLAEIRLAGSKHSAYSIVSQVDY